MVDSTAGSSVDDDSDASASAQRPCPVLGIGASAGGLAPCREFLRALPRDLGMAYVIVMHFDPQRESHLADILAVDTAMPVQTVEDDMLVELDHVYCIPSDSSLTIDGDRLRLVPPTHPHGRRSPIDIFLRSLATNHGDRAVALILSGNGCDGTIGVQAIKSEGGIVLVQDPDTAEHAGMPSSAIDTGIVDFTVAIAEVPAILREFADQLRWNDTDADDAGYGDIEGVLRVVRTAAGLDFRGYKPSTLQRRIRRRASLLHFAELSDYLACLREDPTEARRLRADLLINVTAFFRDADAWNEMRSTVIPDLASRRCMDGGQIRSWVAGCASGEEAYSLAMLLADETDTRKDGCRALIYASDIVEESRHRGRKGIYPANIALDVEPYLLERYMTEVDGHYQVVKSLREMVVFANQNLLVDPPFSNLDLITCRNLLIYLRPEVQRQVIEKFHFALNQDGYLFLGSSENLGRHADLFRSVSKKWRIYQRRGERRRVSVSAGMVDDGGTEIRGRSGSAFSRLVDDETTLMNRMLLRSVAPSAVLLGSDGELLAVHGDTQPYLRLPAGRPTDDIFALAHDDLKARLRRVLRKARSARRQAVTRVTRSEGDGGKRGTAVLISVWPDPVNLGENDAVRRFLVTFQTRGTAQADEAVDGPAESMQEDLEQLEQELYMTQIDLLKNTQELQESNERHRVQKEEIMSMNEELQTANEELETSKEELQLLNEELVTVNRHLEGKLDELESVTDDLSNLLRSTNIATVFLDREFCIRRFTPSGGTMLNIREGDIGRPMCQITSALHDGDLLEEAQDVIRDLNSRQREVQAYGCWYLRVIQPYRTEDNRIEGVVLIFTDISELKRIQVELQEARGEAESQRERLFSLFMQAPAFISVHEGAEHRFLLANPHACRLLGKDDLLGQGLTQALPDLDRSLVARFDNAFTSGETVTSHQCPWHLDRGEGPETVYLEMVHRPWRDAGGAIEGVMLFAFDVTEQVQIRRRLEDVSSELGRHLTESEAVLENLCEGLVICDAASHRLHLNSAAIAMHGFSADDPPRTLEQFGDRLTICDLDGRPLPMEAWPLSRALSGEVFSDLVLQIHDTDNGKGRVWYASCSGSPVHDQQHRLVMAVVTLRDISQRIRQDELATRRSTEEAISRDCLEQFASLASHDLRAPLRRVTGCLERVQAVLGEGRDPDLGKDIHAAIRSAARMRELIDGLLQFARMAEERLGEEQAVSLEEVLDLALEGIAGSISNRNAQVAAVTDLPLVRARRSLLARCLQNLILASIHHCEEDPPVVTVGAERGEDPGMYLITIRDNGPGIDPEEREAAFWMFHRSALPTRSGTDIGLAFCRRIIEASGGRIWVAGEERQGATFCFTLKAAD